VETELFPINMINFDNKKVLVRSSVADKGMGKEVIIGNTREAEENIKVSSRKVMAEKTLDGGETLKITITTSNVRGQTREGDQAWDTILRIADGPACKRRQSGTPPDSPGGSGG
jgi:hypothetical protein